MKLSSLFIASFLLIPSVHAAPVDAEQAKAVLDNYSNNVHLVYSDASKTVLALQSAIKAFVADPSPETHAAAKNAWLSARTVWGQTEVHRFYEGPIDDASYGVEGLINAWPLDEAYIDYVVGNPTAGIISDVKNFPVISKDVLLAANENGSETNVATGFHAIEFLLWGQDLSSEKAGERSHEDFLLEKTAHADRRAKYLTEVTDLLVEHVSTLVSAWSPSDKASYGATFSSQDPNEGLTKVFKGMTSLLTDELAGERMYVGYESKSQEDEHSCFSDNTHVDIIENVQGVINVWTGVYGETSGVGVRSLVDAATARKVDRALASALAASKALPTPYDSLLIAAEDSEESKVFLDTILTIQDAGTAIKDAGLTLGIELPVE